MRTFPLGLLTGAAMLAVNFGFGVIANKLAPSLSEEYQNESVFRPFSDPRMLLMWLQPIAAGIVISWIWIRIGHAVPGRTAASKGMNFALAWFLLGLPGMIISYGSFQVSGEMVMSWTLGNGLQAVAAGSVLATLSKPKNNE